MIVVAKLSLVKLGLLVSEEKIFVKVNGRRRTPSDNKSSLDLSGQLSKKQETDQTRKPTGVGFR